MALIREATVADVPALLPMVENYWAFEGISGFETQRVAAALGRLLSDPRLGRGWIAFIEGAAVGYLLAVYVFSLEHFGLTAELDEFFVSPLCRGKGIGADLLAVAEEAFLHAGCTNASLQLSRRNHDARRFYHRHGYVERSGYDLLEKTLRA